MKGVIVAAGLSQPPLPLARSGSKALHRILARPLIDYAIEAFAQAGFEELGIVLGHNGDIMRRYLEDSARYGISLYCLYNKQYPQGNATSVYTARAFVRGEPFILAQADYLVSPHMLHMLLRQLGNTHAICVACQLTRGSSLHGATKVGLDGNRRVQRIGKRLRRWHAVYAGLFLFQPQVFAYLSDLQACPQGAFSIESLARQMIASGDDLYACDVSDAFWLDGMHTQESLPYVPHVLSVGLASVGLPQDQLVA